MTKAMLAQTGELLDLHKLKRGRYPGRLVQLVEEGYARREPTDGWGNAFVYEHAPETPRGLRLGSLGADGKPGGSGYDADIRLSEIE